MTHALASIPSSNRLRGFVIALILALCAFGNLPWTLDEYDQAKQAFVAYEIATGGDWLYQHTPRGQTATKPPLAGWISLGLRSIGLPWDIAWRLPGFVCMLVLLGILMREGRRLDADAGALLAAAAFGLNLLTPRISTLVRTDMMLTLWIFLCGWLIYRKIRDGSRWTGDEKFAFAAAMLAALLTKGPIIYAFLLPGMAAFLILAPRDHRALVWSGWWTWLAPLGVFVAWGLHGILTNEEFYRDVIVREFFSRFDQTLKADERQQPIWFYFPHLIHKFLPWSLLLIALPIWSANVRAAIRNRPEILWLACWGLGGLICMTFVPSKRVDRIFPIIPPLCMLLVAMVSSCQCGNRVRAWAGAAVVAAILFAGGYFAGLVWLQTRAEDNRLVTLGQTVWKLTTPGRLGVVDGRDEGMILYTDGRRFLKPREAAALWNAGSLDALLVPERELEKFEELPPPALVAPGRREPRYFLFVRPDRP
ncbi:MAG: glycosyltransferase family 39 protein [Terrimicrobiaceae bacterium]|nr:glycosyltransferase family 39 protein [Terrimicrobiaceae bacterium]